MSGVRRLNYRRFDIVGIHLAVLCADFGTLSEAARRACLSVSGASRSLRCFESAVGHEVFQRHAKGLSPTNEGLETIRRAREVLQLVEGLVFPNSAIGESETAHREPGASTAQSPMHIGDHPTRVALFPRRVHMHTATAGVAIPR
jgi:DNA-binding transcriptional LysR family regulator